MRFNRKLLAAILTLCLMLSIASPAAAAVLEVTLGEASYYEIATTAYSRMLLFENGVVAAANQNKQYGLIDATGKVVVPFQYAGMWTLGGGLYRVSDSPDEYSGRQGVIDSTGKAVLPMQDNRRVDVQGNILRVTDGQYNWSTGEKPTTSYYTLDMKPSTDAAYDAAYNGGDDSQEPPQLSGYDWWYETGDYYRVFKDNQTGLLDKSFRTVFALGRYDTLEYAGGSIFVAGSGDDCSVVDTAGRVIVAAGTYDHIETRGWGSDATITVTKDGQKGVIDTAGKLIVPLGEYNEIGGQNQLGYIAAVTYDGEAYNGTLSNVVSRIYKDGALVKTINGKYVATEAYYRQLVFSTTGELNGVMDINEKVLLPEKYEQIYDDSNGNLVLCVPNADDWNYTYGLATMDGKRIFEDRYTQMNALEGNNYKLNDGTHYGIMNAGSGKTMLPFRYQDMRVYNNSFIELYDGVYYSCADINSNVVVPNSSTPIVLFGSQPAAGSLSYDIDHLYLGEYYDGGVQNLQPFCITTPEGLATVYADYTTGKATDRINGVWASNINQNNQFAYRASNGLYGLGTVGTASAGPVNPFNDVVSTSPFYDSILWAVEQGITAGTSTTTFSPGNACTRAQILTFLWRAAGKPVPASQESPYSDVTSALNPDFYNAILWAAEKGIAEEGETFGPGDACTRKAAVEFMWRYAGKPEAPAVSFTDAADSMAVNWAVEQGITNGTTPTTFSPDNSCTRAHIVTFLYRAFAEK